MRTLNRFCLFLSLSLIACSSPEVKKEAGGSAVLSFDETVLAKPENQIATGNLYFVERLDVSEAARAGAGPALDEFEARLRKKIEAAGYRLAADRTDAHLYVYVSANKTDLGKGSYSYTSSASDSVRSVVIKGGNLLHLSAYAYARAYRKRPLTLAQGSTLGALESFFKVPARSESFERFLQKFPIPAAVSPSNPRKPSCYPSFGFQARRLESDSEVGKALIGSLLGEDDPEPDAEKFALTKVIPKGPADKAGMKVGDIIEAIDSVPYPEFNKGLHSEHAGIYEAKEPVPVKFRRAGKLKRSTIRSENLCE